MKARRLTFLLGGALTLAANNNSSPQDLALRMLASIEQRGQTTLDPGKSTGYIQLALFWQALSVATEPPPVSPANDELRPALDASLASTIPAFANITRDAELPLDRFSLASDMVSWTLRAGNDTTQATKYLSTTSALNASIALQPRNANGGLWYYNNVNNLTAYRNLSYLDGMYSYPPFITVLPQLNESYANPLALESALEQIQILYDICVLPSGLLVHGYDAIKAHHWANATTGASPEVWGRALAWYSLGILNTLEAAAYFPDGKSSESYATLKTLFQKVMYAQVQAAERSKTLTGVPGVWQVVDKPGEAGNFVEASSSFMTVNTLLRGVRMELLDDQYDTGDDKQDDDDDDCSDGVVSVAKEIYESVSKEYLITYANGSLSLNGTSSVSSLSPQNVSYAYYISRPTELDSLIGTSAFALASYEVGLLDA
jgi:rhamnogalacturonyl hydrolase YesR